jgi:hypothetical protein
MHSNNLGLYLVANGEGLHILAEHKCASWGCTWDESLHFLYDEFRNWCARNRVTTSQRRWTSHHLHTQTKDGPCFVWLQAKAFNSRLILAWLAETKHHYEITVWIVWTTFFLHPDLVSLSWTKAFLPGCFAESRASLAYGRWIRCGLHGTKAAVGLGDHDCDSWISKTNVYISILCAYFDGYGIHMNSR